MKPKLGDLAPDFSPDRWRIWRRAIDEFLWPTEKLRLSAEAFRKGPVFQTFAEDIAIRELGLFPAGSDYFDEAPTFGALSDKAVRKWGPDAYSEMAKSLDLWRKAWDGIAVVENEGAVVPAPRKAAVGLKFCLVVLVLKYGLGEISEGRVHPVARGDALDGAALLLALSVLCRRNKISPPDPIPWFRISELADLKLRSNSGTDLGELRNHSRAETITGFVKRLRATMPDPQVGDVRTLAAEFGKSGKSSWDTWFAREKLHGWFPLP